MKIVKKISRTFLTTLLFGVFLLTIGYILLRSRPFQNWAAQKTVNYLAQEFKTKVSLKSIDFELLNKLVLEGLYLEDREGDTLAYFGKLKVSFNYKMLFDSKLQLARLNYVLLDNTKFNMVIHKNKKDYNYQFVVDYFSSPVKSNKPFVPFKLFIRKLDLKNVDFCLRNENENPPEGRKFDENYMLFKGINSKIYPFKLVGDSLNLEIKELSFREKSGFNVNNFSARTTISSNVLEFFDLNFQTKTSNIGNYLKFSYHGWNEFSQFESKIKWEANLANTKVSMHDISFFSDELLNYNFTSKLKGNVTGTLEKLVGKNMDITIGELNKLKGDLVLLNITNPDKLAFDCSIFKLTANPSSIKDILKIPLPEPLLNIGSINFSGDFTGALYDFTTNGLFETTIGNVRTDLNLKFPKGKPEIYKGEIETFSLNLSKLLNDANFGETSVFIKLDGEGFNLDDLNTKLEGNIHAFHFQGYNYKNAKLDGLIDHKIFDGKFEINDPNVNFKFNGSLDLNIINPGGDFIATVGNINLKNLGYGDIDIQSIEKLAIDFKGSDIDDLEINAQLNKVILERNDSIYNLGSIDLKAFGLHTNRSVELTSILGNLSINGQFKLSQFNDIYANLVYNLFPDYYLNSKTQADAVNIRFEMDINDSRYLSALFLPNLSFYNFNTSGIYNSTNQSLDMIAKANFVKYQDYTFNQVSFDGGKKPNQRLSIKTTADNMLIKDSFFIDKILLIADLGGNDINFKLNASDSLQDFSIRTGGNIAFAQYAIDIKLTNSILYLMDKPWAINNENLFHYENDKLKIDSFKISNLNQFIAINGQVSSGNFNALDVNITEFNLAEINPILKKFNTQIAGLINGKIALDGNFERPIIISDITIDKLVYNSDSVGDLILESHSDGSPYNIVIDGHIKNGLINDLQINGNIDLTPNNDKINLICEMNRTNIRPFEAFTVGLFSGVYGIANGIIRVKGKLSRPNFYGEISVDSAGLFVDYLGLPLQIPQVNIDIDEKKIDLNSFVVKDKMGSKAEAGGKIYHTNFDNLRFDIYMKNLNNFNCMNLREDQSDLFFGTAYVDGNMKVTGSIDDIILRINAKTRAKTVISLPLTAQTENTGPDFIKIIDLTANLNTFEQKKLSGITMDFNFDVTPDAEFRIIFDSKFNDVMSANGRGNIKMELNTFGDFAMYGRYEIERGHYNFTALNNLVNTNLKVKEGSKITWQGDPLGAQVDILAVTTVKANPTVLVPSSPQTLSDVYVDCEIYMREDLFAPKIDLGISLSKSNQSSSFGNNDVTNAINQIKADPEETNKQFVNLLVFRSFAPINSSNYSTINAMSTLQSSVGDFLTSQVNSWLSQIAPNWELDVDYQSATTDKAKSQVIVKLGRKLFNEKVFVEGSVSQGGAPSYEVNVSYKPKKDGRFKFRGFNTKANDPASVNNKPVNTQGIGFFYRIEMDYLFPRLKKKQQAKKQQTTNIIE